MSLDPSSLYAIQSNGQDWWLATSNGALIGQSAENTAWQITDCGAGDGYYYIYDDLSNVCLNFDSDGSVGAYSCYTNLRIWNVQQRYSSAGDGEVSWYIFSNGLWLNVNGGGQAVVEPYALDPDFEYTFVQGSGVPTDLCTSGNLATAAPIYPTDSTTDDTDTQTTPVYTPMSTTDVQTTPTDTETYPTDTETYPTETETYPTDTQTVPTDTQTGSSGDTAPGSGFNAILSQLSTQTVASATIQTPSGVSIIGSSPGLRQVDFGISTLSMLLLVLLPLLTGLLLFDPSL